MGDGDHARNQRDAMLKDLRERGFLVRYDMSDARHYSGLIAYRRSDGAQHRVKTCPSSSPNVALAELQRLVDAQWQREMARVPDDPISAELERLCSLAVHGEEPPGFNAADQ